MKLTNYKKGLTAEQVAIAKEKYGANQLDTVKKTTLLDVIIDSIKQPMFIFLVVALIIYLLIGEPIDASLLFVSIVGMLGIDIYQDYKTDKSLEKLKDLAAPQVKVVRDGQEAVILSADLVPGDVIIIEEGLKIPADCVVADGNDLKVDESTLTGEPAGVWKSAIDKWPTKPTDKQKSQSYCYAGTFATQGSAKAVVVKIGAETEYGKIGSSLADVDAKTTPLQVQIAKLVKYAAILAAISFLLVVGVTYFSLDQSLMKQRIVNSLISGIAIGISMIPEEFPVILTVFLSMGAWRLARKQALVRKVSSVEILGAVSNLCVDKTGTLTVNDMQVKTVWSPVYDERSLAMVLGLACEQEAYDPMEQAMLSYCQTLDLTKDQIFSGPQIYDYSFSNELKMMGQAWKIDKQNVVAVKGSTDSVLKLCQLDKAQLQAVKTKSDQLAMSGMRVIAVATTAFSRKSDLPKKITDLKLEFCGLVALVDPPRAEVKDYIETAQRAGVRVAMITGDNGLTAKSIAQQVGIEVKGEVLTGQDLDQLDDQQLIDKLSEANIFSRVTPEHKMRLISAFQARGEVTAMIGDGVNDAPALKKADIGIAMSQRGSDVSREAADLILLDDNFGTVVKTIADGRRIYDNIRKSIAYVLTIQVPIVVAALLAPLLGIELEALMLLPIHVILLEMVTDPTCSIILEREPARADIMLTPPRDPNEKIISFKLFLLSMVHGLVPSIGAFGAYYYLLKTGSEAALARTVGLSIIMFSSLLWVHIIASGDGSLVKTFIAYLKDKVFVIINLLILVIYGLLIYSPAANWFKLTSLNFMQLGLAIIIAVATTMWVKLLPSRK